MKIRTEKQRQSLRARLTHALANLTEAQVALRQCPSDSWQLAKRSEDVERRAKDFKTLINEI